jgi:hypothetical protein
VILRRKGRKTPASGGRAQLPERLNVSVLSNPLILGNKRGAMMTGCRHEDLIGRIAVKRLRQLTAFNENRPRQLPDTEPWPGKRLVKPFVERAVEDELLFLDLLGDLPHRN